MNDAAALALATIGAGILSLILCRAVMALGVVDAPDGARKTQKIAVPTSGGLGFAIATLATTLVVSGFVDWRMSEPVAATALGAFAACALGLADDRMDLPARLKLVAMLAIALAMVAAGVRADALTPWPLVAIPLPLVMAAAGSILWLVVVVNAVNFMDGANGLSMGMALVSALGVTACGAVDGAWDVALLAGALSGALAGFLVWNWPGKLFAGDAGALFTGAALGGLCLVLVSRRPDWLFIPPMLLMPFLVDVLLTLAWRAKHGKKLFAAHRDHVYQIAIKAGLKHWQVSAIHIVWSMNAMLIGVIAAIAGGRVPLVAFIAVLGASVWVQLRVRKSGVKAGLVGREVA